MFVGFLLFVKVDGIRFNGLSIGQQSKAKAKLSVPKLKVWSSFSKVVGAGNAHKLYAIANF